MSRVVAQGDMRPFDATRGATNEAMEDLRRILTSREALYARANRSTLTPSTVRDEWGRKAWCLREISALKHETAA